MCDHEEEETGGKGPASATESNSQGWGQEPRSKVPQEDSLLVRNLSLGIFWIQSGMVTCSPDTVSLRVSKLCIYLFYYLLFKNEYHKCSVEVGVEEVGGKVLVSNSSSSAEGASFDELLRSFSGLCLCRMWRGSKLECISR